MKRILFVFLNIFIFISLVTAQTTVQDKKLKFVTPLDYQRWTVLDNFDFDKVNNWDLGAKKDVKGAVIPEYKRIEQGFAFSYYMGGRFRKDAYSQNKGCLGVKIAYPELLKTDVFLVPKETYKVNGYCKKISFWLLGRGRNVDIELVIKDYKNQFHYVPVGKLDFLGWRYFEIYVPQSIPQSFSKYPQMETIEIAGFLVTNNPEKYADSMHRDFYLYIDQLEVLYDQYFDVYPGIEIEDNW